MDSKNEQMTECSLVSSFMSLKLPMQEGVHPNNYVRKGERPGNYTERENHFTPNQVSCSFYCVILMRFIIKK